MSQADLDTVKRGYAAFGDGDMETLRTLMADDVTWHVPGSNALSGTYEGMDEVFTLFGRLAEMTQGTFRQDIHDMLESDDHVVALLEVSAQRGEKSMKGNQVHVLHVRDGKVKDFWSASDDQAGWDDLYA